MCLCVCGWQRAEGDFLRAHPPPATVQVFQDGGWWRASFIGAFSEPLAPPLGAPPVPEFVRRASENAPKETLLVQILDRPEPAAVLRVGASRLRPDWGWSRAGWALAQPPSRAGCGDGDPERGANVIIAGKSPRPDLVRAAEEMDDDEEGSDGMAGGVEGEWEAAADDAHAPLGEAVAGNLSMGGLFAAGSSADAHTAHGGHGGGGQWLFRADLIRLPPDVVDKKMWPGAAAHGWAMVESCRNGHKHGLWRYCAPDGTTYRSRTDAIARSNPVAAPAAPRGARAAPTHSGPAAGGLVAASGMGAERTASATPAEVARLRAAAALAHPRHWARVGMAVEARLSEPIYRGAWWEGELLELTPRAAYVSLRAFAARDGASERLCEWVPWGRVRPQPPDTPADFIPATRFGEAVEVWWADGWWEATLVAMARPPPPPEGGDLPPTGGGAPDSEPPPADDADAMDVERPLQTGPLKAFADASHHSEGVVTALGGEAAPTESASSPTRRRSRRTSSTERLRDDLAPCLPPWEHTMAIVTRRSARMQRHAVAPTLLRPGWRWGGAWSASCIAPPPPPPPPLAAKLEDAPAVEIAPAVESTSAAAAAGVAANATALAAEASMLERLKGVARTGGSADTGTTAAEAPPTRVLAQPEQPPTGGAAPPSAASPSGALLPAAPPPIDANALRAVGHSESPFKRAAALALRGGL